RGMTQHTEQTVRAESRHRYCVHAANHLVVRRHDLYWLKIWGAAHHLARMAATFLEQNLESLADTPRVELRLMPFDQGLQTLETFGFLVLGNLIREVGSRRSGARRIFERIGARETHFVDEGERLLKIILALAGKAHDEIRRKRHVRPGGTD